ncbi:MAG: hypothetical protein BGO25_09925 [Acidobacteriales bacterium 59-55]|nr:hypothetical protein [Terriglobales bacterium]OJV42613.1 MAG: hypothetical protein BGO25_09925 [Acidobacteriales bacterium 59-55]
MKPKAKAILINSSIVAALIYQYWKGTPFSIIVITGILLLVVANLSMMFAAKKRSAPPAK